MERCKKKSCLSLSIFTLGLIWVRTKDENRRIMCQDCLGMVKGAAASIWGKEQLPGPSTIFLTYFLMEQQSTSKLTWQRKIQVSQRRVYDSGDQFLRKGTMLLLNRIFFPGAESHPPRPSSLSRGGHSSCALCHSCPTLTSSSSDRCGHYFLEGTEVYQT